MSEASLIMHLEIAMKKTSLLFIFLLLLFIITGMSTGSQDEKIQRTVSETFFLDFHDFGRYGIEDQYYVSPDNSRLAYVTFREDKKASVMLDGKELKKFPNILERSVVFSPDNSKISYVAQEKTEQFIKTFVVVNEQENKNFDFVIPGIQSFSPDSKRIAYIAQDRKLQKTFVVMDETELVYDCYPVLESIQFSSDSKHYAYLCKQPDEKQMVILDGKPQLPYDEISALIYSSKGDHVAYTAQKDKKWYLLVDGNIKNMPMAHYTSIDRLRYSPDGRKLVFVAKVDNKSVVVFNSKEGNMYDNIIGDVFFSPDSNQMAYVTFNKKTNKKIVILNGKGLKEYDDIGGPALRTGSQKINLVFSPDSKHLAYTAYSNSNKSKFVVVDGKEGAPYYDIIEAPLFSHDSSHITYQAQLIIDMKIQKTSEDKTKIEYTTEKRKKNVVVLDSQEFNTYEQSEGIVMSPDSKFTAFRATQDNQSFVVINSNEGSKYDKIISPVVFDSPDEIHYLVMKINDIYLIREKLNMGSEK